jgi:hypothetical protein
MRPQQHAVKVDLDRVADDPDADGRSDESIADAITGPGETY